MVNLSEEEKEAIETLKNIVIQEYDWWIDKGDYAESNVEEAKDAIKIILNLIEKQEKEIEELKWKCNNKYYHTIKCRELEKEINNGWKDKINKLKEEVETELISNPYDFSYLLN